MKYRWLALGFTLFLLWGCGAPPEPETLPATEPEGTAAVTEAAVPSGLYLPDSDMELATERALQIFPLGHIGARGIRFLGDDILVFSETDSTVLTLLSGDDRYISAGRELDCSLSPDGPGVSVTRESLSYYDAAAGALVILDKKLEETASIPIPNHPAAGALDRNRVYYCTGDGLRVLEPESGIDRLLKQMSFPHQELTGIHRDGTVLECSIRHEDGSSHLLYLSADNGSLLYETAGPLFLHTEKDFYFAIRSDGNYWELLSGSSHFGPSLLVTDHKNPLIEPVSGSPSAIIAMPDADGQSTLLDYYDLESGHRPYQITVPGSIQPRSILADPSEKALWFLYRDASQTDILCRWNLTRSETADSLSYLRPRSTLEAPDREGLQHCQTEADAIGEKHGVRILIWQDAVCRPPGGHTLIPEYQVPLIESCLKQLDQLLSRYPAGFLKEAASNTGNGYLTICLVRAIEADPGSGVAAHTGSLQYWDDQANAYLAVAAADSMEQALDHGLFHFLESHLLCNSKSCDDWQHLNPKGFDYAYDYTVNLSLDDPDLISGEARAFTDSFAMSYPREDRARIMEYACMPGNAHYFTSDVMQNKLEMLCEGIRKAFGLEKVEESFLWEQYLNEPLT